MDGIMDLPGLDEHITKHYGQGDDLRVFIPHGRWRGGGPSVSLVPTSCVKCGASCYGGTCRACWREALNRRSNTR